MKGDWNFRRHYFLTPEIKTAKYFIIAIINLLVEETWRTWYKSWPVGGCERSTAILNVEWVCVGRHDSYLIQLVVAAETGVVVVSTGRRRTLGPAVAGATATYHQTRTTGTRTWVTGQNTSRRWLLPAPQGKNETLSSWHTTPPPFVGLETRHHNNLDSWC